LEEPHPVVADCLLQQPPAPQPPAGAAGPSLGALLACAGGGGCGLGSGIGDGEGVAYSGWTNESVVWTSDQLPFVATYNDVSGAGAVAARPGEQGRRFPVRSSTGAKACEAADGCGGG
jgi:hypothetical protein